MTAVVTIRSRVALTLANWAEKIAKPGVLKRQAMSGVDGRGWWSAMRTGFFNFQKDTLEVKPESVYAQWTAFSCMTLIAGYVGKLRPKLMEGPPDGIRKEVTSPSFSPILRQPNHIQTWQKFIEQWVLSLMSYGNAYVLKRRDDRRVVTEMYVLDPSRVTPLVAEDGSVYYALQQDDLSKVGEYREAVPASEIIHDRINCLFHPLVGLSPIYACGLAATQALKIQENSAKFFKNMSRPGGVLTAPAEISEPSLQAIKDYIEKNFSGDSMGKIMALGDGMTYSPMSVTPVDAQLVEQLQLSATQICATFHVPPYMVGAAAVPPNNNVEALTIQFYDLCLQPIIESIENFLTHGLGLGPKDGKTLTVELDLDGLLRMDTMTLTNALKEQVGAGITKINEARRRLNLPPVTGGDTCYLQQQNFSLAALNKRDAKSDPFKSESNAPTPDPAPNDAATEAADDAREAAEKAVAAVVEVKAEVNQRFTEILKSFDDQGAEIRKDVAAQSVEGSRLLIESLNVAIDQAIARAAPKDDELSDEDVRAFVEHFDSLELVDA